MCGSFGGNFGVDARESNSTRPDAGRAQPERRPWGQLQRRRSTSLARRRPLVLIAVGDKVSTSRPKRATPTARSMVDDLASAGLKAAWLTSGEDSWFLPESFGSWALRDEKDCLAREGRLLSPGSTVDRCSRSRARDLLVQEESRLALARTAQVDSRFGDGRATPAMAASSLRS